MVNGFLRTAFGISFTPFGVTPYLQRLCDFCEVLHCSVSSSSSSYELILSLFPYQLYIVFLFPPRYSYFMAWHFLLWGLSVLQNCLLVSVCDKWLLVSFFINSICCHPSWIFIESSVSDLSSANRITSFWIFSYTAFISSRMPCITLVFCCWGFWFLSAAETQLLITVSSFAPAVDSCWSL